jgi:hypothetical protein
MSNKKVDWKLVAVLVLLVGLSVGYMTNQDVVKNIVKSFLTWPLLPTCIWLFVLVSFVIHYLSVRSSISAYEGLIYKAFGKFADSAFAAVTYNVNKTPIIREAYTRLSLR